LKDITNFDNIEFGVSNKDALAMTATTRRLIEMSFLALLDAGIDSRTQRVGSFMSGTNVEYFEKVIADCEAHSEYLVCGLTHELPRTSLMIEVLL
jgi:acyl transferase domain-containing protein